MFYRKAFVATAICLSLVLLYAAPASAQPSEIGAVLGTVVKAVVPGGGAGAPATAPLPVEADPSAVGAQPPAEQPVGIQPAALQPLAIESAAPAAPLPAPGGQNTTAAQPAPGGQNTAAVGLPVSAIADDYRSFWYLLDPQDEAKTTVLRKEGTNAEYDKFRGPEMEKWKTIYSEFLQGNFANAATYGFTPEKAAQMAQIDPATAQRLTDSPAYFADLVKQMAEWAFFYDQLDLWNKYVEQSVIRETLPDGEKPPFNPATVESELPKVYDGLKKHAETVAADLYRNYKNTSGSNPGLVDRIERSNEDRKAYTDWLGDREKDMLRFVELWRRQYDGSELWINQTQYLVRNLQDRPENPEDDNMRLGLPDNAVLLEVPKGKLVTPYDLIDRQGRLKTPDSLETAPQPARTIPSLVPGGGRGYDGAS